MEIEHRPGRIHINADALSRMPTTAERSGESHQTTQEIAIRNDGSVTVLNIHPQVVHTLPTDPGQPSQDNEEPGEESELNGPMVVTSIHMDEQLKSDILRQLPHDKSFGKLY
jgi:hypothetical protein